MEMKKIVIFMVMMLTIKNLTAESEVLIGRWGDCIKTCYNICITGPIHDRISCLPKCAAECGPHKEIDVKKAKGYVN
ncbi:unnamed protein product [Brassica oleracea var. botrytis]|uniref:Uncharacterized protein n=1 Tax=Brassica oleracea TaxID=3712 RepID=A0A3P6DHX6_BRAOL|nr:unnamed protein product [Brassica oleracea]